MLNSVYAEDIFLSFYSKVRSRGIAVQNQDLSPIESFYDKISSGSALTKNQANYIIKLLEKYKTLSAMVGFDYREFLADPQWKNPFRVLDLEKKIYIEKGKSGQLEICLKFPYQLKKEFDEEINVNIPNSHRVSHWDQEEKIRRLNFYDFNLISLYEFATKHAFEVDDTFLTAVAEVEEIWQDVENLTPRSKLDNGAVTLTNAGEEVKSYFENLRTGIVSDDALLAKSMGYPFEFIDNSPMHRLVSSHENTFWIKDNRTFFDIFKSQTGIVCIILDRQSNTLQWLQNFVSAAETADIPRDFIKVCFRDPKESNSGINDWIRSAGVGGKVESGRILIFESKPAKWLFKDPVDVKILVTNNIYPPTNVLSRDWFHTHPCVIYLGPTKPTEQKGRKIVEL